MTSIRDQRDHQDVDGMLDKGMMKRRKRSISHGREIVEESGEGDACEKSGEVDACDKGEEGRGTGKVGSAKLHVAS